MVITPDNRTLFTAGIDGSIFIYQITEQMLNPRDGTFKPVAHSEETQNDKKEKNKDARLKVVDDELADIVLVKKNEMDEW
jgi:hypothetical protein